MKNLNALETPVISSSPQQKTVANTLRSLVGTLRTSNPDFEYAYETYSQQYGPSKIVFDSECLNLSGTVDPAILIFGRNCVLRYHDSSKRLSGMLGSVTLEKDKSYVIGRREPQDQVVVCWSSKGDEVDLAEYNSETSIIPSRVHGAFSHLPGEEICYTDLGSSSGTVIIGESLREGPFIRIYEPERSASALRIRKTLT